MIANFEQLLEKVLIGDVLATERLIMHWTQGDATPKQNAYLAENIQKRLFTTDNPTELGTTLMLQGLRYDLGLGIPADGAMASTFFQQAIELGNTYAMTFRAIQLQSRNNPADLKTANALSEQASKKNNPSALMNQALLLMKTKPFAAKQAGDAAKLLIDASQAGCIRANYHLVKLYDDHRQLFANFQNLKQPLLKPAMDQGHIRSIMYYAHSLQQGFGVKQDEKKAAEIYEHVSERGQYPEAFYALGKIYAEGRGRPKNLASALAYYERGVKLRHPQSMVALAKMLLPPIASGKTIDYPRAAKLLRHSYLLTPNADVRTTLDSLPKATNSVEALYYITLSMQPDYKFFKSLLEESPEETFQLMCADPLLSQKEEQQFLAPLAAKFLAKPDKLAQETKARLGGYQLNKLLIACSEQPGLLDALISKESVDTKATNNPTQRIANLFGGMFEKAKADATKPWRPVLTLIQRDLMQQEEVPRYLWLENFAHNVVAFNPAQLETAIKFIEHFSSQTTVATAKNVCASLLGRMHARLGHTEQARQAYKQIPEEYYRQIHPIALNAMGHFYLQEANLDKALPALLIALKKGYEPAQALAFQALQQHYKLSPVSEDGTEAKVVDKVKLNELVERYYQDKPGVHKWVSATTFEGIELEETETAAETKGLVQM